MGLSAQNSPDAWRSCLFAERLGVVFNLSTVSGMTGPASRFGKQGYCGETIPHASRFSKTVRAAETERRGSAGITKSRDRRLPDRTPSRVMVTDDYAIDGTWRGRRSAGRFDDLNARTPGLRSASSPPMTIQALCARWRYVR